VHNCSEVAKTLGKLESEAGLGDLPVGGANLDRSAEEIASEGFLDLNRRATVSGRKATSMESTG